MHDKSDHMSEHPTKLHALTLAAKVRTTKGWATAGRSAERALVLVAARTAVRDAMRAAAENMVAETNTTVGREARQIQMRWTKSNTSVRH